MAVRAPLVLASGEPQQLQAGDSLPATIVSMATASLLGRATAGVGGYEVLTPTQARTILGLATTDSPSFVGLRIGTNYAGYPLRVRTGTDINIDATIGSVLTTAFCFAAVNDADSVLVGLELRGNPLIISGGGLSIGTAVNPGVGVIGFGVGAGERIRLYDSGSSSTSEGLAIRINEIQFFSAGDTFSWRYAGGLDGTEAMFISGTDGGLNLKKRRVGPVTAVTYSSSMTIDASLGNLFVITITNNSAFTINAATKPATGQIIFVRLKNTSGAASATPIWNAVWKQVTVPVNSGTSDSYVFYYDGTNWVQIGAIYSVPN